MTAPISSYWKFQLKNVLPMNIMTHRARSGSHLVKCIRRVLDFILELPILEFQSYRPYRLGKRRKICNFPLLHARAVIIVCAILYCVMGVAKA